MRSRRAATQSSAGRQRASACSRALGRVLAGRRVGTEELHRALLGVQGAHRVGHQLVGDVGVGVDDEAVVAEAAGLGRAAEQVGQVDPPGGELLQDRDQAARLVGPLVDDEPGAVVARRRRDALPSDEHEPGLVAGVVGDVGGEHVEAVERRRRLAARWRPPRRPRPRRAARSTTARRVGRRVGDPHLGARQRARARTGGTARWRPGSSGPPSRRRAPDRAGRRGTARCRARSRGGSAGRSRTPARPG